jgi:hypothetical protein
VLVAALLAEPHDGLARAGAEDGYGVVERSRTALLLREA